MQKFSRTVQINILLSMFHFRLHDSTAHLSIVLKLSRRFATKWNLLCWKYKIANFILGTNTKSTNLPNHENWCSRRKVRPQYRNITTANPQTPLNISNTIYKNNQIDLRQWYCRSTTLYLVSNFKSFLQRTFQCRVTRLSVLHHYYRIIY